ncbi:anthranilate phosphoribosyltransferase [Rhodothalassium salexigens DSM 2132]|uniref:Anthranilate phosphoribosyltransferase n=1 Tax=Rhodothalassium salexigens DSM 2132 TaxID=1188247 RepID=A0A4V2SQ97_RHOSA|nr:anthranilate phosphoribosyltransferase [Rhodothalassium salexigens]MBB4209961.1 anthranilate phosphoribosyltransferase [Rhodothalassium salexigens DSM 2132]MBK1637667.1 anthranilate phosphoribosyltransferase [Rhodothalassium salexigens DSM 2132]TCP38126.1 anthranilate phosphoribosyltransferase [Rhodothalassium salexigens DSM 2132]
MARSALHPLLARLADGHDLSRDEAARAFDILLAGQADPAETAALLMGLRVKGETVDEITGAAEAMRAKAHTITAPDGAVDTCGTGGDGLSTVNVSTAAALVAAAAGVPIAKHGNVSVSSRSGSADVLDALGVRPTVTPELGARCLDQVNITFLMAPAHHRAMKAVAPVRKALGLRTIFNLLGPLANPAGTRRQLVGVYDAKWLDPVARTLARLGADRVWVVHGRDGMDELTVTGPSDAVAWENGALRAFTVHPEDAGLATHPAEALVGGTPAENAQALAAVLAGQPGAYRDITLLNAAAALVIAGQAADLAQGATQAAAAIDDGRAADLLARWAALTQETQPA